MKKIIFGLLLIAVSQIAAAQKELLQFDESNNYVYYQVTELPNINADTLYQRAWQFARQLNSKQKPVKGEATYALNTKGEFLVYTGSSIVKKETGSVSYTLNIEAKDQKYRYKLGDFVFTPYKRDRFNNMVPVPGINVRAEDLTAKYSAKEADSILSQIASYSKSIGDNLKRRLQNTAATKKPEAIKKVSTENW
jgi:hypothetical protein